MHSAFDHQGCQGLPAVSASSGRGDMSELNRFNGGGSSERVAKHLSVEQPLQRTLTGVSLLANETTATVKMGTTAVLVSTTRGDKHAGDSTPQSSPSSLSPTVDFTQRSLEYLVDFDDTTICFSLLDLYRRATIKAPHGWLLP